MVVMRLLESGGRMGRPADVLSGTQHRTAARGAGGTAVEQPQFQTKTLTVSKSVSRGKGELVVTEPKTENSIREIYLSDEAIRLLVEDRKNHPFSPYMFPSPKTGGMYGPDCVGRIHKKLLEKAGIEEHVRFHDLRHTFSTLAIQSGIDPKRVAEILGHASAEFSLDVYAAI